MLERKSALSSAHFYVCQRSSLRAVHAEGKSRTRCLRVLSTFVECSRIPNPSISFSPPPLSSPSSFLPAFASIRLDCESTAPSDPKTCLRRHFPAPSPLSRSRRRTLQPRPNQNKKTGIARSYRPSHIPFWKCLRCHGRLPHRLGRAPMARGRQRQVQNLQMPRRHGRRRRRAIALCFRGPATSMRLPSLLGARHDSPPRTSGRTAALGRPRVGAR